MFRKKFYATSLHKCVDNINFLPNNKIEFTLLTDTNNITYRLRLLKKTFPKLNDVDCHGLNYPIKEGLRWLAMTFPSNMSENEVKTWFYFILGNKKKTIEFANTCSGDIFQTEEKSEIEFHSSTQFYTSIREVSFKENIVTFKTLALDQIGILNSRINTLKQYCPRLELVSYTENGLEKPKELLSLKKHTMIFPEDMSESDVKSFFYFIVGDEEYFRKKEEQQSHQRTSTQNKDLLPSLFSQLANTKCEGLQNILHQIDNNQQERKREEERKREKEEQQSNQSASTQNKDLLPSLFSQLANTKCERLQDFLHQINNNQQERKREEERKREREENNYQGKNITNALPRSNFSPFTSSTFFNASIQNTDDSVKLGAQPQQSDSQSDDELFKDPEFVKMCCDPDIESDHSDNESTDSDKNRKKRIKIDTNEFTTEDSSSARINNRN